VEFFLPVCDRSRKKGVSEWRKRKPRVKSEPQHGEWVKEKKLIGAGNVGRVEEKGGMENGTLAARNKRGKILE